MRGLQLAQADLDRNALSQARLVKIRDTVLEFARLPEGASQHSLDELVRMHFTH
jgi:hypothetical protein